MEQEKLKSLAYLDESETERYDSKAVFSEVEIGVEVEEYDSFRLYTWEEDIGFDELIDVLEPFFPFTDNPAFEMLERKTESVRFDSGRNYETLRNDFVYDPVREWRGEDR